MWHELGYNLFGYAGETIGIASVLMTCFNLFAWKWRIINKIVDMPILANKYSGKLVSDWNGENKQYECKLEIKQTFLSVSVVLKTNESRSYSILSAIDSISDSKRLVYLYQNEPRAELQNRSSIHKGTSELWIEEDGKLQGNYYTDRKTKGSMIFEPEN
jgi:hypothetical protein